ncbi:MAG: tetratricopeptide repeat protein [Bacteroidota bacterium]
MGVMDDRAAPDLVPPDLANAEAARAVGDFRAALDLYNAVLAIHPRRADAMAGRGAALRALGHPREALVSLLEALSRAPDNEEARLELALALRETGRRDEARTLYSLLLRRPQSLAQSPAQASARAWHGLALLCQAEGQDAAAESCLRRAVALAPAHIDARLDLGDLLARRGHLAEAADWFHGVLSMRPGNAPAHAGLGQALIGLGRLQEAEDQLERALVMDADNVVAHLARARLNLLAGDLPAAWDDLDWRWSRPGHRRPEPPGVAWDGNADLSGHTLLLWAEQGVAETIHLLRYVPLAADRGARVVLGVPQSLVPLAAEITGAATVLASGQPLPDGVEIDLHASLSDLPRLFGTTLDNVPPAPYLSAPESRRAPLRAPSTALLKVGVAWAGDRDDWSVPLVQMMPLLALPGIAAYSLQTGPRAREAGDLAHPALIADLSASLGDFADLAARIAEMDMVVAADGAVAHLAGALGVPVCVLLPQAPDWRWMLDRDDSPYYASARLFRQSRPDNWNRPVQSVCAHLRQRINAARADREARAVAQAGPRQACRAFLATHLLPGDLLVDVGAGDGTFAMDAASHPADDVRVLTIEARPGEAAILADTIAISGAEEVVEVIAAPLAAQAGPAVVSGRPRAGRSVFPLPGWVRSSARTTTLDAVLAERPDLAPRRLVLHLGARGTEDEVLAGLTATPAVVIFTHRAGSGVAERLRVAGYTLVRFPGAVAAGPVVPFAGEDGPVLALAAGLAAAELYGDVSDPTSPAAMARAATRASTLAGQGSAALVAGDLNAAGALFARALAVDPDNVEALTNLGALLRRIGRGDAAVVCWNRALANGAGVGVRANTANVLRELGYGFAAEEEFTRALTAEPANPHFLYGFGLLERERGHAREAVALFERAEHLRPGAVPRHQLAAALLKSGNLARGMAEMAHRPPAPLAKVTAPAWDGGRLDARTILVRDENDAIDAIMLARFIPQVARHGGLVVVECVPDVARLLAGMPGVEQVVPRGETLPEVDLVTHLPDVPRLIGTTSRSTPPRDVPYLHLPDGMAAHDFGPSGQLRVGIAWSGRATDRSVPLTVLLRLAADPRIALVSLQRGPRAADLTTAGATPFVEDLGKDCADLADSAALIAGLDLIVAADTAEAHLAGAMGKPVWVLLPTTCDWRWVDGREDAVWYPTMRVFRQNTEGSWQSAIDRVAEAASAMAAGKVGG